MERVVYMTWNWHLFKIADLGAETDRYSEVRGGVRRRNRQVLRGTDALVIFT